MFVAVRILLGKHQVYMEWPRDQNSAAQEGDPRSLISSPGIKSPKGDIFGLFSNYGTKV